MMGLRLSLLLLFFHRYKPKRWGRLLAVVFLLGHSAAYAVDYGDAPSTYGNGSHTTPSATYYLGSVAPDNDTTIPTAAFNGTNDDTTGTAPDDEDGVWIPVITQGQESFIAVNVNGAGGYLQAWIDWNGNGSFGAGEQVATNLQDGGASDLNTATGTIEFSVTAPSTAVTTKTYARFRWSATSGLTANAVAGAGEIEDYGITIKAAPSTTSIFTGTPPSVCTFDNLIWYNNANQLRTYNTTTGADTLVRTLTKTYGDIAWGADGKLYGIEFTQGTTAPTSSSTFASWQNANTTGYSIYEISSTGSTETLIYSGNDVFSGNSLSSDNKNWLYFGSATINNTATSGINSGYAQMNDRIYRYQPGGAAPNVWIDLGSYGYTGRAAGDFVFIDGYAYILWATPEVATDSILLKVGPFDSNNSVTGATTVTNLGSTSLTGLYGLSGNQNGQLFSVDGASNKVYRITTSPFAISQIGSATGGPWGLTSTIESSSITCLGQDHGDAPASYGDVTHTMTNPSTVYLGTNAPDMDASASAPLNGTGDDVTGSDDEDGVTFLNTAFSGGTITASVSGAGGYLQGWIDWNRDGDFVDAGEQVATNLQDGGALDISSSTGEISFRVTAPAGYSAGASYARFRWSTTQNLTPTGSASNGEVEDYPVTLVAQSAYTCPTAGGTGGYATSGTGLYKSDIFWFDWSCGSITQFNPGDTVTKSWTLPNGAVVTGVISNITDAMNPYNTGDWTGDLLDDLYGGVNPIGLKSAYEQQYSSPDPAFNIQFTATLNGTTISPGFVMAEAEDLDNTNESLKATTDGDKWQPIEGSGNIDAQFSADGKTITMSNVTADEGSLLIAASSNAQNLSVVLNAGGTSAAAFGTIVPFDYGDAPASYGMPAHFVTRVFTGGSQPTTLTPLSGLTMATGSLSATYILGTTIDTESMQPTPLDGTGDNATESNDEDGITLPTLTQGQTVSLSVKVSGTGYLQGWIDWNGNGTFEGGEQIAADLQDNGVGDTNAASGTIGFNVTVPVTAVTTATYARIRWSSTAGLSASALALNGEVEDYPLTVTGGAAPVITSDSGGATAAVSMPENQTVATIVTATDANAGDTQTYSITGGADAAKFVINATSGLLTFVTAPDFETPTDAGANNVYDVQVTVTDSIGLTDVQDIAVTVTDVAENVAPVITSNGGAATATVSAAENQTAVTTVTATDANAGDTLTYSISGGADSAKFAIDASTGVLTFVTAPDFEIPTDVGTNNVYDVQVTVTDNGSLTDVQDIAVTVTDVAENVAPVITSNGGAATAAVSAAENQTAATTVTATDANAGDTLTYTISGGADAAKFAIDSSTGVLTFVTAPDFETPTDAGTDNVYDVQVTVTDNGSLTDVQDIAVTVTDVAENVAPVITSNGGAATAAVGAAENQTAVTTVTATDANAGDTLTYSITGGADAGKFAIDASTGVLTFVAAPDFEAPTDAGTDNVYDVQVTVSDGSLTDVQDIAVTVTDVAENVAPVITSNGGLATAPVSAAENQTAVTTVTATDANAGDTLTYSITGGADAAKFTIDSSTGVLTFVTAPDFETPTDVGTDNVYDVQVTVTDNGSLTDVQDIAVTVADIAENGTPAITSGGGGATAAVSVPENQTAAMTVTATDTDVGDTLTYSISGGADAAKFAIDASTGVLTFVAAPDFEAPTDVGTDNVYDVQVTVSDGSLTDVQDIAVAVTDVAENVAPVITSNGGAATAAVSAAENQTAATTVTATDANAGDTLTYSISGGADAAKFAIDASTGVLTFVIAPDFETPTDADTNNVYDVQVTVTDNGSLTDVQDIAVTVTDVAENVAPVITSNGGAATASVGAAENQTAVTTVTATDANAGDTLTYTISGGADAAKFAIDASTGVLTFVTAPDFETPTDVGTDNVYDVQVTVTDTGSLTDVQDIAVTVTDVAENVAPVITSNGGAATAAVSAAENQTAVTTVTATDANAGDTLTYSITGGADSAKFAIDASTGVLTFVAAPDFEAPTDVGTDNVYDVQVTVTDTGSLTDVQDIAVTVTDVAENVAPVITSNGGAATAAVGAAENQTAVTTVTATDANAGDTLTYTISGGADAAKFAIDASTGVLTFIAAPDFETPTDAGADNVYDVQVTVTDTGSLTDVQDIAVTVTDVAENVAPVITSNGGAATAAVGAAENQTAVTTVTATDANAGDTLTYTISGGADAAKFAIDASTGVLTFVTAPDFETPTDVGTDNVYDVQVTVTDNGSLTDVQDIAVTVADIAENGTPAITSGGGGATAAVSVPENQTAAMTVTATDTDVGDTLTYSMTGGADAAKFAIDASTGVLTFVTAPDFETPTDVGTDNVYDVQVTVTDNGSLTDVQDIAVTVTDVVELVSGVQLQVRTLLQGPYSSTDGLMADNLRSLGLIPTAQPYAGAPFNYAGTETVSAANLAVTGNDAIVDWVLVDVRDTTNTVVEQQAALLQRDGDVVDASTLSTNLTLSSPAGNYLVAVRHRNHLGVVTASAVALSATPTLVDFTLTSTTTKLANGRLEVGNLAAMWAGDASMNQQIIAAGPDNDGNAVIGMIVSTPNNPTWNSNYRLGGYLRTDLDMNGVTLFAGPGNDMNLLLGNMIMHPANVTGSTNFVIDGELYQ